MISSAGLERSETRFRQRFEEQRKGHVAEVTFGEGQGERYCCLDSRFGVLEVVNTIES